MNQKTTTSVSVVYDNACESCDAVGPQTPIVRLDTRDSTTFICETCAKLAVGILRVLGLCS